MKPIKIVKLDTSINFLSKTKLFVSLSLIFIIASIFLLFSRGLNFGIDFMLKSQQDSQKVESNQQLANENLTLVNEEKKEGYEKTAEIVSLKEFMRETNK